MTDYPLPYNDCDLSGQVALVTGTTFAFSGSYSSTPAAASSAILASS
jgi:hypothetical protein